jgi:hypothetical protein
VPRSSYPEGRAGYLRWRTALKRQHAEEVAAILTDAGYEDAVVDRVRDIVAKRGLGTDQAVQTHEDALCLVFLRTQLDELADQLGDDHTVEVLRKTLDKMSDLGRRTALDQPLSPQGRALLERALQR